MSAEEVIPVGALEASRLKKLAVIGRGPSATTFCETQAEYDAAILCNFVDSDFENSSLGQALRKTRIVVIANATEPTFSKRFWPGLDIKQVIWAGFPERQSQERLRSSRRLDQFGIAVNYLPSWLSPEIFESTGNLGILAVEMAASCAESVDVFGMDFYKSGYIGATLDSRIPFEADALRASSVRLQRSFDQTVARHPRTRVRRMEAL